jgi:hypothetical protein
VKSFGDILVENSKFVSLLLYFPNGHVSVPVGGKKSLPIYYQISLDTINKNMYGLGVGISTVSKQGTGPSFRVMTYIPSSAP